MGAQILFPASSDYEVARRAAIPRFHDVRTPAVVRCWTTGDVAEAVALARRRAPSARTRDAGSRAPGSSCTRGARAACTRTSRDTDLDRRADAYWGAGRERLLRIKAEYDPDGVFSSTR